MRLRLLSYNIHKGFNVGNRDFILKQIKSSIRETKATLVCLQEVLGSHSGHASRIQDWPKSSQFEFLADQTWDHYAYGKNSVYSEGHHGNAILSKHPIISFENEDASTNKLERRGFLHAVIKVPHFGVIHVINIHLNLFERDRMTQLKQLCNRVKRTIPENEALIIAGDFNDWRKSATVLLGEELGMKEAFIEKQGAHAKTFPSVFPVFCLDRIYFRGLRCASVKLLHNPLFRSLSDHLPIIAEFELEQIASQKS